MSATLVDETLAAHGGMERWTALAGLEATVSASGSLFRLKRRNLLDHQVVRLDTREPHVWFPNFPRPGWTGEFLGDAAVCIRNSSRLIAARRTNPRSSFRGYRQLRFWDDLDFVYFSGYALWNYFTTPFLFTRPGFRFQALAPVDTNTGPCRRLRVSFPPDIPTHSREQTFYFDERGHLVRLDYTADILGPWARGAHVCGGHRQFSGILVPTIRRVTPRAFGLPMPGPTVVALTIHDVRETGIGPAYDRVT